jgi:hypothetical protein
MGSSGRAMMLLASVSGGMAAGRWLILVYLLADLALAFCDYPYLVLTSPSDTSQHRLPALMARPVRRQMLDAAMVRSIARAQPGPQCSCGAAVHTQCSLHAQVSSVDAFLMPCIDWQSRATHQLRCSILWDTNGLDCRLPGRSDDVQWHMFSADALGREEYLSVSISRFFHILL